MTACDPMLPMLLCAQATQQLVVRKPSLSRMCIEVEDFAVRAAFSHIPLWHLLQGDLQLVRFGG